MEIGMENTVRGVLGKLIVDGKGTNFLEQDQLFTYLSKENPMPVRILKAQRTITAGPRQVKPARNMREGILINFGDQIWEGAKSGGANYRLIFGRAQSEVKVPGWGKVKEVKQYGPKIIVETIRRHDDQPPTEEDWMGAIHCPPLGSVGEAVRGATKRLPGARGASGALAPPESLIK
jgi:hypothetical protein